MRVAAAGPGRVGQVPDGARRASRAVAREAARHDVLVVRGTRVLGLPGLADGAAGGLATVLQPEINGELDGTAFTWGKRWAAGTVGRLVRAGARRAQEPSGCGTPTASSRCRA